MDEADTKENIPARTSLAKQEPRPLSRNQGRVEKIRYWANRDEGNNDTVTRSRQTAANAQQAYTRHMEYPKCAAAYM